MDEQGEIQVMQDTIKQMRSVELWPKEKSNHYRFRYSITLFIAFPLILGSFLHMFASLKGVVGLNDDVSEDIAIGSAGVGTYYMLITFMWQQREIRKLWKIIGVSKMFGMPDNFEKRRQQLNLLSRMYGYYVNMGLVTYYTLRIMDGSQCVKMNREQDLNELCYMIASTWAPFNLHSTPVKQILFLLQTTSGIILLKGAASISISTFEVTEYIVLKMRHLRRLLREAFDDSSEEMKRKKFVFCIKYHQHILSIQKVFNEHYKQCNGAYVLMVGIVFAGVANQLMKEQSLGPLLHLAGWLFSFYICCYSGQMLTTESVKIADAALDSQWYDAPVPLQRDLLIFLVKSQQPCSLKATPIGVMTLELFVAAVKTSYSYFTLLSKTA